MRRARSRLGLAFLLLVIGGCASSPHESWGEEAVEYFDAWAEAYTRNDAYGVLDFYSLDATVEDRTGSFREATPPVPSLLRGNTARSTRRMLGVHLGVDQAIALVIWPDHATEYGTVLTSFEGGSITSETIFIDAGTLSRSLRAAPGIVADYATVFEQAATAWTTGDPGRLMAIYATDATIRDALSGLEVTGHSAILALAAERTGSWATGQIPDAGDDAPAGAALFLDPVEYGADPQRAVGVFDITGDDQCAYQLAVHWRLAGGVIIEERRYPEIESFRRCASTELLNGWWTGLEPPGPRDQVETGVLVTPGGRPISVRNGTGRLEGLVSWALDRYAEAGLSEPKVDSVTFEPTRRCDGVAGRVITAGAARDLVLCIDESDLCADTEGCVEFALGARVGMLHELAHAWMLDEVGGPTRDRVLALSGRKSWVDDDAPWRERGVEYAAQVLAWGLADAPTRLVELGGPPCEETTEAFTLLTGIPPRRLPCATPDGAG